MMECLECRQRLERSLAGAGTPLLEAEAAEHMKSCADCSQYWEALQQEGRWIEEMAEEVSVPESVFGRIREVYKETRPISFHWRIAAAAAAVAVLFLPFVGTLWISSRPGIDVAGLQTTVAEDSELIVYLLSSLVRSMY